jgi:transcriptional regulator with XRE-family HTH domain
MKFNEKDFVPAKKRIHLTSSERLRHLRELQELSQVELAELTGIPQSNISAMETGQRNIGRERAVVLAKVLQVHPALLLFPELDDKKLIS